MMVKKMWWKIHWTAIYMLKLWLKLAYLLWILRHCIILLVIVSNGCFLCSSSSFTCLFKLFPAIFYFNVYEFVKSIWLRLSWVVLIFSPLGAQNLSAETSVVFNCVWKMCGNFEKCARKVSKNVRTKRKNVNGKQPLDKKQCKNIIKNKTCFKSLKGSCIDLILTNRPSLHQFKKVFDTGVSDHHLLNYTMLKSYTKMEPKVLTKRFLRTF